jgi:uncharacterized membrane protein YfcA
VLDRIPIGIWLLVGRRRAAPERRFCLNSTPLVLLAAAVGGIYGIGGGSILAPILIGAGRPSTEVAPATLASTSLTSIAGVVTFVILGAQSHGSISPDWPVGIALGLGGLGGGYIGARLQRRLPELAVRRLLVLSSSPSASAMAGWPSRNSQLHTETPRHVAEGSQERLGFEGLATGG